MFICHFISQSFTSNAFLLIQILGTVTVFSFSVASWHSPGPRLISSVEILANFINLHFCHCADLASSFVHYTTNDVWHVYPCGSVWTSAFRWFIFF